MAALTNPIFLEQDLPGGDSAATVVTQSMTHWCSQVGSDRLPFMDWMPLLSTLAGAVIGIAATVIADRNRWRREESRQALELRRAVYTEYVACGWWVRRRLWRPGTRRSTPCADCVTPTPRARPWAPGWINR
jgi:hypothetical protein